jgi:hypothetical protein
MLQVFRVQDMPMAHNLKYSRVLTGLGEAESCEQLLVQVDRMILLHWLTQALTERMPIPARSGGPTNVSSGLHQKHCGAIESPEDELKGPRSGAMPL